MPSHVALLYSIVLTPSRRIGMAELRATAQSLGLRSVRTLVSTGNLVFDARDEAVHTIERQLEHAILSTFGKRIDVIVRTAAAWRSLAASNPFPLQSREDGSRVVVRVMRDGVAVEALPRLRELATEGEAIERVAGDLWAAFPSTPSKSRLLTAISSPKLGVGTSRNWNTVRRLGEMLDEGR